MERRTRIIWNERKIIWNEGKLKLLARVLIGEDGINPTKLQNTMVRRTGVNYEAVDSAIVKVSFLSDEKAVLKPQLKPQKEE